MSYTGRKDHGRNGRDRLSQVNYVFHIKILFVQCLFIPVNRNDCQEYIPFLYFLNPGGIQDTEVQYGM